MILSFSDVNFDTEVMQSKQPVLVSFSASGCKPCKAADIVLEQLLEKKLKIKIGKVEVSKYPKLAAEYCIGSLPTLCLFTNGMINQYIGKPTVDALEKFLKTYAR